MSPRTNSTEDQRRQPWNQRCANKREKKKAISGGNEKGVRRNKDDQASRQARAGTRDFTSEECMLSIAEHFRDVSDPRVNRRRLHLLIDIVVISLCAVICSAESWKDIQLWGETHQAWLEQFLELPHGIPSRCTFRRVVSRLNPAEFQDCFRDWIKALSRATKGRIIAVDGKTLRRSMDSASELKALHVVSAWASEQHLTLGQIAVEEKSNEITAIPRLLRLLELKGALITIDAMGCQKQIARQIVEDGGDYCLAVKGNQETLYEAVREHFSTDAVEDEWDTFECEEKSHGRYQRRYYYTTPAPEALCTSGTWSKLTSLGLAITYRAKNEDQEVTPECRYYILSVPSDAQRFADATRLHWGIENSLHWVLDVSFDEDRSRIRKDHGAENFGWLRRFAVSLLKNESTVQDTIRAKRMRATYNVDYLEQILLAATNLP